MRKVHLGIIPPNESDFRRYSNTVVILSEQRLKLKKKGPNSGITTKLDEYTSKHLNNGLNQIVQYN